MLIQKFAVKTAVERDFYEAWDAAITDVSAMRVTNAAERREPTAAEYRAMIARLKRISMIAKS